MSEIEIIVLPHLEEYPLHVMLFEHVQNSSFLRDQLLQGNTAFEYAFLDASMIFCREHLLAACFKALHDMANQRLKTRNVHSEIVFALSPNNNIAESFRRFGLSPESNNIIAIKVATSSDITPDRVKAHLTEHVQGDSTVLTDERLLNLRDLTRLRKVYKFELKTPPKNNTLVTEEKSILGSVMSSMALRGL